MSNKCFSVILRYYDTNGHNFGVESPKPDLTHVQTVFVKLPNDDVYLQLKAIEAYRKARRPTLRSPHIDSWLRKNAAIGDIFSATLEISKSGEEHKYQIIKKL